MRPILQDSDGAQYNALLRRLERLEQALVPRVITVNAASSISLGDIDGNGITGVRITLEGYSSGTGTNTFLRIKPNGLATMPTSAIAQRAFTGATPTYTATADVGFGSAVSSSPGIVIAGTDWGTTSNEMSAQGVFSTRSGVQGTRHWLGLYWNRDRVSDGNSHLSARIDSIWNDNTTVVSSLVLAMDAGTFTGNVVVETI